MNPPRIAILSIGSELLSGRTLNSNAAEMGRMMRARGYKTVLTHVIPDTPTAIRDGMRICLDRADVILCTGGLGPTLDDMTKQVLMEFFGGSLILHEATLARLEEWYRQRNRAMNDSMRGQAMIPDNCEVLINLQGTAPGMHFRFEEKEIFSLPGVPKEMRHLMETGVLPALEQRFGKTDNPVRIVKTFGIPESEINERFKTLMPLLPSTLNIAWLPTFAEVKMELSLKHPPEGREDLERAWEMIASEFSKYVFTRDDRSLEKVLHDSFTGAKQSLSVAESCTGGTLASLLTSVSGASKFFRGGLVPYQREWKSEWLGISEAFIAEKGIVSEAVAIAMAEAVRERSGSDFAIGITGTAEADTTDPDYSQPHIWIALAGPRGCKTLRWAGFLDRNTNIRMACNAAMFMAIREIQETLGR